MELGVANNHQILRTVPQKCGFCAPF